MVKGYLYEARHPNGRHDHFISSKYPMPGFEHRRVNVEHLIKEGRREEIVHF